MAPLRFDANRIDLLGRALRSAAAEIHDHLLLLEQEASVLREGWTGEAQRAYESAHREWSQSLAAMHDLLSSCAELAAAGARRYDAAEKVAQSLWT
ncbi:WXG100 family type VII secretion target [Microbacterium sp. PRF11]|uniref:WXG100 family type VII secretion target n=1 Tax=Microbacterium sp. PRF11 TaxID=2962593 RepID=UPI002880F9AD|nr:WXG100 family type VII secretion target [Microbacterium sp. PRF11]MDT0115894.1 WXG100 family type VII secretion target [Microbacterium sp. PRF11]